MSWKGTDLTRTSDIIRLCIAHRYGMSYVDLDIMFLVNTTGPFLREYVPACIWGDEGTLYSPPFTPYLLPSTLYPLFSLFYSLPSTLYPLLSTLFSLSSTLYPLLSTPYLLPSTLFSPPSTPSCSSIIVHTVIGTIPSMSLLLSRTGASLEITNSAFCLSRPVLEDMMKWQLHRIKQKERVWFYTELGPSMFAFVLLNKWPVPIISQNHPLEADFPSMMKQIKSYSHSQLHITTMIRMKLHHKMKMDYLDIFESIRRQANLPQLVIPS